MSVALQQRKCRRERRYEEDAGKYVGLNVLCDFFRLRRQTELLDERACRFFDGRVAAQESHTARLQALHADVLEGGGRIAGIIGCVRQRWAGLAWIKEIAYGGVSRLLGVFLFPFPHSVLFSHGV